MPRVKANAPVTETDEKPAISNDYETVINCSPAGGSLTDMNGQKVPVGGSCELPYKVCESLVARGICRYQFRGEINAAKDH